MATTTLLLAYPLQLPSPAVRSLCQSWWTCHSAGHHTWRNRCDALLATGQPLSVVPHSIREQLDLVIRPEPGWKGQVPAWYGIACRIGRVSLWLPIEENPGELRELALLTLLPKQDLEAAPPYIQLGTQFLIEYNAQLALDASTLHAGGQLVIP
ncbi:MAG: hypothetical protein L0Z62_18570 [Gemmataceae bacterium]|nr:hypothetical protein [Gemmataceae bacterium]